MITPIYLTVDDIKNIMGIILADDREHSCIGLITWISEKKKFERIWWSDKSRATLDPDPDIEFLNRLVDHLNANGIEYKDRQQI